MAIPLSDLVPLRTSAVWPAFAKPEPLPVVYGRCTVPVVQFDVTRKFWLVADHAIAGVDAVYRDGKPEKAYAWRNGIDPTGHPVALVELATALASGADLAVAVRGKTHPSKGGLIENPADVLQDILHLAGTEIADSELTDFRVACAGISVAGMLSAGITLRAQLAELADSVGMIWAPGLFGLARRWPVVSRPTGEPLHVLYAAGDIENVQATSRYDGLYTRLRVEYDWDWMAGNARQSITLQADSVLTYGARETVLQAKWLTSTALAVARGTDWLHAHARPRWSCSFDTDFLPPISPGGWFFVAHPLLPESGENLALDTEWNWKDQSQTISFERSMGPIPSVSTINVGGLFAQPESNLRVTYANGIATLVVFDPNGAPIADALVILGSEKRRTDKTGTVRFKVARGNYPVTIEATGYVTINLQITL